MDKWARLNPDEEVDVPADMTRLTLDTIALCGFGYRFNSFYRETPHPFVEAMVRTLEESQNRMRQLPIQTRLGSGRSASRRGPGVHERPGDQLDRRAPRSGRGRPTPRPARADADRGRQADRRKTAGREHPGPVHHVPHRRSRDDLGPALLRDLLPAQEPRDPRPGPAEVDARARHDRARPPSSRSTSSRTSARSSTSRSGCGRPRPVLPPARSRTR